jgi:hypothetical protein
MNNRSTPDGNPGMRKPSVESGIDGRSASEALGERRRSSILASTTTVHYWGDDIG